MPPKTVPRGKGNSVRVSKQLNKMKKAAKTARASRDLGKAAQKSAAAYKKKAATTRKRLKRKPSSAGSRAKTK